MEHTHTNPHTLVGGDGGTGSLVHWCRAHWRAQAQVSSNHTYLTFIVTFIWVKKKKDNTFCVLPVYLMSEQRASLFISFVTWLHFVPLQGEKLAQGLIELCIHFFCTSPLLLCFSALFWLTGQKYQREQTSCTVNCVFFNTPVPHWRSATASAELEMWQWGPKQPDAIFKFPIGCPKWLPSQQLSNEI